MQGNQTTTNIYSIKSGQTNINVRLIMIYLVIKGSILMLELRFKN